MIDKMIAEANRMEEAAIHQRETMEKAFLKFYYGIVGFYFSKSRKIPYEET